MNDEHDPGQEQEELISEKDFGSAGPVITGGLKAVRDASKAPLPVISWFVIILGGLLVIPVALKGGLLFIIPLAIGLGIYAAVAREAPKTKPNRGVKPFHPSSETERLWMGTDSSGLNALDQLADAVEKKRLKEQKRLVPAPPLLVNQHGLRWDPMEMQLSMARAQENGLRGVHWVEQNFTETEQRYLDFEKLKKLWLQVRSGNYDQTLEWVPSRCNWGGAP